MTDQIEKKIIENIKILKQEGRLDELIDVLDYSDTLDWENLTITERFNLLKDKWIEIREQKRKALQDLRMGEKLLLKILHVHTGYSNKDLRDLVIKFGDVGKVAEYACSNPLQKNLKDFKWILELKKRLI